MFTGLPQHSAGESSHLVVVMASVRYDGSMSGMVTNILDSKLVKGMVAGRSKYRPRIFIVSPPVGDTNCGVILIISGAAYEVLQVPLQC